MNRQELVSVGISKSTIDKYDEYDISRIVEIEECESKEQTCYRKRTLDRLIGMNIPFQSTQNNDWDVVKRYVKVECPYCGSNTIGIGCGGNSGGFTVDFRCSKCDAKISVSLSNCAFYFVPPKK